MIGVRFLAILVLSMTAVGAQAKPLYLTVPRSFGTEEKPTIDVAFADRGPVELRVVKPSSLDSFLTAQINLRRAYERPSAIENPGRFLSRGFNSVHQPGRFLYNALGVDFRRGLAPALPAREETSPRQRPLAQMAEGPERLVSLPPGTTLVRRQWLNLDLGGSARDYNVPGFDVFAGGFDSKWEERQLVLDPLPAGVYLVQVVQGRIEGQVVLAISDLKVQVKQTDGDVLVRVAGKNLAPLAGAEVRLRSVGSAAGPSGRTDAAGEVHLANKDPRLLVVASSGGDVAVVDTDFYSTLAASPDVFVYTDRPIYRPGDAIRFRGIARQPDGFLARLFMPKSRTVTVKLAVAKEREVVARAQVDEFGSFSGQLEIPNDVPSGVVRLEASLDNQAHSAEARVDEYVKPTFYLEVLGDAETVRPGEVLKAKIRARRYSGGAPAKTRYQVFLYRSLLDSPAWVDDAGLGAQGSAVTYGTASTTEGKLSVPQRLYSSIEGGSIGSEEIWESAAEFDASGEAEIEVPVPALEPGDDRFAWRYTLSVRARDDQGTFANGARSYYLSPSEVMGTVRPGAAVVLAGDSAPLAVRATTLSGAPFGGASGSVDFFLRQADGSEKKLSSQSFTTGIDGVWRGTMPAPNPGTVVARVTLKDRQGHPWSGEGSLLVAGKKGEESVRVPTLQLASRGEPLAPGDTAELVALFPDGWGPGGKRSGKVWLTLSGTGIFSTRLLDVDGLSLVHRFEVERRFGSTVYASIAYPTPAGRWVERTQSFRIIPTERVLTVSVAPEKAEAEPLGSQTLSLRVTDHQGRGVKSQVSVGVVDKAIYALQGELRPRVLDFFYPLVRNNVATFTSAEFQGYGYGEPLARLLRQKGYAFAAVKPPTKTREVDTAYWNPAVTTDEDGRARVTFSLPTNQTLWTVTAVAADTSGRFGEGTGEFASRGGTLMMASTPLFLRAGDRASSSIRVARGEKGGSDQLEVSWAFEGSLASGQAKETVSLAPRKEKILPFELQADKVGTGRIAMKVIAGDRTLTDRRELPIRPSSSEEIVAAASFGGGKLELPLPAGAEVEEVTLSLRPSSVALALAQIEELLTYPHGCLEQLVATTIPNIALYRVMEKTGAVRGLEPGARALLTEARSRSVQGIDRILALARPGGGFTWFSGYEQVSVPLTLIALDGLSYAAEAGLVSKGDSRLTESIAWLGAQDGLSLPLDATRAYVLARLEGSRQATRVRALLEKVASEGQPDLYPVAIAALAADRAGITAEPPVQSQLNLLIAKSQESLSRPAELRAGAYFDYPLRRAGLTAVIAHAASLKQVDLALARRRLAEVLSDRDNLSTFERSTAILHSLWLIERDAKEMKSSAPPSVEVEGGKSLKLEPRGAGLGARLDPGSRSVKVASFEGQAELRARIRVPLASSKPVSEGMSIERTYYRLSPDGTRRPIKEGEKVAQGDEVYVELTLDAHDGEPWSSIRSAYYMVQDPIPAGFTPLAEDKTYRGPPYALPLAHEALKYRSLSSERALFYFDEPAFWSRTPRKLGYVLRAAFPGRYSAPPATIEDMYAPRVHGRSSAAVVEVAPPGASR